MKKLKEIAALVGGEIIGDGEIEINGVNGVSEARPGELTFLLDPDKKELAESTGASAVIVPKDFKAAINKAVIKVENPSMAFSKVIDILIPDRIPYYKGIHPSAVVSKTAKIGNDVSIGPYTVIEDGVCLGDGTIVHALCYVGKNTKAGKGCIFYPNVTIREEISIGNRVIIHPGSVIGADGFGYDTGRDGVHVKIPQVGIVIIEDDVEVGACVMIDRARFAKTVIGRGTKIDNLVQIAHNVSIGPNCIIAAQAGISGSSELGTNVVLGGQVGIADHLKLGNFVVAGAQSGITKSFPQQTTLFGYPAKPVEKMRKILGSIGLLPKLFKHVSELAAKVKELEKK